MLDAGRQEDGEAYLRDLSDWRGALLAPVVLGRALERRGASPEEARRWYELARSRVSKRDAWARNAFEFGLAFRALGDDEAALRWYREAAEHGDLGGMNNYGAVLRELGRSDEAEPWFVRAATVGSEAAADNLRRTLWKRGVRPGDIGWAEEARWFTPAAEAGQILAARWLRRQP
jgi:TPR repeat protein